MSLTQRYLIYISYVGTGFRGSQIQNSKLQKNVVNTVQGTLVNALYQTLFLPKEYLISVGLSSRTDSGVHALKTGVHVDLPPYRGKFIKPEVIKNSLNKNFLKSNTNLRIIKVVPVPDIFHARFSALEKVYLYRFAVSKENSCRHKHCIPILESERTYFLRDGVFNLEKVRSALSMFVGEKDFGSFRGSFSKDIRNPICNIKSFVIEETQPLMPNHDSLNDDYNFYHFICIGNRFLYQMVRRMVGTLLCVGLGKATLDTIQLMFDEPKNCSFYPKAQFIAPGYALYLSNVIFKPEHLVISVEEEQKKLQLLEKMFFNQSGISESRSKIPFLGFKQFCDKIHKFE